MKSCKQKLYETHASQTSEHVNRVTTKMGLQKVFPTVWPALYIHIFIDLYVIFMVSIIIISSSSSIRGQPEECRKGDGTAENIHRTQIAQFELFELLLWKLDRQLPAEQFEATVSLPPSPPSDMCYQGRPCEMRRALIISRSARRRFTCGGVHCACTTRRDRSAPGRRGGLRIPLLLPIILH